MKAPDLAEQLAQLAKMYSDGNLTDGEFKELKTKLISGTGAIDKPKRPIVDDTGLAVAVYVLYFVGYLTGFTALIGVIIAHMQKRSASFVLKSHYTFQIRTFWIGLLYLVVGSILLYVVIGGFILLWWFIWSLIRCIKGILALNRGEPIANPTSWGFGN